MSKVKVVNIIIARDPMTKIPKEAWPWEVPVFRSQYGDENVSIVGDAKPVEAELPDASEEYYRLRLRFGIDADTRQSHADLVYGRGQDGIDKLEKAIKASAATGDVEKAQAVVDDGRKLSADEKAVRADAHRDPLDAEFSTVDQDNMSGLNAAAGGPGDASKAAGKK